MQLKRLFIILSATILLAMPIPSVTAESKMISEEFSIKSLSDGKRTTYTVANQGGSITLISEDAIAHLYIEFDRLPTNWEIVVGEKGYPCDGGYLHQYIDVAALCGEQQTITLRFTEKTAIADLYFYSNTEKLPDFVQKWSPPCEKADLMLLTSHSDDEQLFFAGLLPYYAVERKLQVQVVYIVQHFGTKNKVDHVRPHEQLDGLWTVGIRNYPVMSDFPDLYSKSKEQAEVAYASVDITYDDFKEYITQCLRRFKPLVTVSHDLKGEYGHGTHIFCSTALTDAINEAADASYYPQSSQAYGTWRVKKTYLHLYKENQIVMDWDTPCESLGGKTPFEITQEGFGCHKSQHWTWFKSWLYGENNEIKKASQIKSYSPCRFGLYDSQVGADEQGGDFMENITTYAEQEEIERKRQEQLAAEKAAAELAAKEHKQKQTATAISIALAIAIIAVTVLVFIRSTKKEKKA